jgi:hypothetical protein
MNPINVDDRDDQSVDLARLADDGNPLCGSSRNLDSFGPDSSRSDFSSDSAPS